MPWGNTAMVQAQRSPSRLRRGVVTYTYLYERDGSVEGYLTFRGGEREKTELNEFIALTPRAHRGLLGLLHRHDMQSERFVWKAPDDDLFWMQVYQDDVTTTLRPVTMGRVIDLVGALQGWKPSPAACGSVVLAVQDECAPWNTGVWKAEFEAASVSVRPTREAAQVTIDIQALSQAYLGTPTVNSLRAAERLTVHDEAGYHAFRTLCDGPPMWLNDHY
jgi:predicted acetyltransferase